MCVCQPEGNWQAKHRTLRLQSVDSERERHSLVLFSAMTRHKFRTLITHRSATPAQTGVVAFRQEMANSTSSQLIAVSRVCVSFRYLCVGSRCWPTPIMSSSTARFLLHLTLVALICRDPSTPSGGNRTNSLAVCVQCTVWGNPTVVGYAN